MTIFKQAKHVAEGRWEEYLEGKLGLELNDGKATECPLCGGDDRFTFHNNKGDGNWYCRGPKGTERIPHYGDGLALATEYINKTQGTAYSAKHIASDILHHFQVAEAADPQASVKAAKAKAQSKAKRTEAEQETFERIVLLRTEAAKTKDALCHPYVASKGLQDTFMCANETGTAVAPSFTGHQGNVRCIVVDYIDLATDTICGVELIAPDGTKRTTGRKGVHMLPYYELGHIALVVEGWATGVATNKILREDTFLANRYRVVVAGGCGMAPKVAQQLGNKGIEAHIVYEDDGAGTPAGALAFPVHGGNDAADWHTHKPTCDLFLKQLRELTTN